MRAVHVPNGNRSVGRLDGHAGAPGAPLTHFWGFEDSFQLYTFWSPSWREWLSVALGRPIRVTYRPADPDPAMSVDVDAERRAV